MSQVKGMTVFNTEEVESNVKPELNNLLKDLSSAEEEACDSCAI